MKSTNQQGKKNQQAICLLSASTNERYPHILYISSPFFHYKRKLFLSHHTIAAAATLPCQTSTLHMIYLAKFMNHNSEKYLKII